MKTILGHTESLLRERGSRFIGYLFPCETEEEFRTQLDALKTEHYNATHHCYAYRIDPNSVVEFNSDDGEPSGTAGLPILNQLRSADLINAGTVIVRYYGGTKLGKSGLIEAYKGATELLTHEASLLEITKVKRYQIRYSYSEELVYSKMETDFELFEESAEYTDSVSKVIACKASRTEAFENYFERIEHLGFELESLDKTFLVV